MSLVFSLGTIVPGFIEGPPLVISFCTYMRITIFVLRSTPRATRALQTLCYDRENVLPVIDAGALGRRTGHAMG